jgi:hypothetical protein
MAVTDATAHMGERAHPLGPAAKQTSAAAPSKGAISADHGFTKFAGLAKNVSALGLVKLRSSNQ